VLQHEEKGMKFACLGYCDEGKWNAMSKVDQEAFIGECFAYDDDLLGSGHWLAGGQALQSIRTAKTLRRVGGKVVVTDGPFAETKEQLGGIGMLEATDMQQAVALMSKHPGVRLGPFEIRPVDVALTERCEPTAAAAVAPAERITVVCLACGDETTWNALSKDEQEVLIEECIAYDEVLRKHGRYVGGAALQSVQTAKTLHAKGSKVLITDGPYAETKEQLGGLAVFEFRNMDDAIRAWSTHPCLRMGDALELRPVNEELNAQWEARQQRLEKAAR
jgi:hypothetical protein